MNQSTSAMGWYEENLPPSGLSLGSETATTVDVVWNAVSAANEGYIVERATSMDFSDNVQAFATGVINDTSFTDSGLVSAQVYYYRVLARNAAQQSNWSTAASTTTLSVPPPVPGNLSVTPGVLPTDLVVAWDSSPGASAYEVWRDDGGGMQRILPDIAAPATSYADIGLAESTLYSYQVLAENAAGQQSAFTSPVSRATGAVVPLDNPSFEGAGSGDLSGWTIVDLSSPLRPVVAVDASYLTYLGNNPTPTHGNFVIYHGFDGDGPGIIRISQDATILDNYLAFEWRAQWFVGGAARTFDVQLQVAGGGGVLTGQTILSATGSGADTGMVPGSLYVSAHLGQVVHVTFEWWIPENYTGAAGFHLDNIRFQPNP